MNCRHISTALFLCAAITPSAAWAQSSTGTNTPPAPPMPSSASTPTDVDKVERLLAARREYQASMEQLRAHYLASGDIERAKWAEEELTQYHRILKQAYRLELDVPPPTLQGHQNIPEANELYKRAMAFKGAGMRWSTAYTDNQRRSEMLFQQLLTNYPQSDKIDATAYQLGDIYESSAYKQYRRSAQYFERCFEWNPKTQLDARLRAARLYDHNLQERTHAIELYREIVTRETDLKHIDEANKRLTELSQVKKP